LKSLLVIRELERKDGKGEDITIYHLLEEDLALIHRYFDLDKKILGQKKYDAIFIGDTKVTKLHFYSKKKNLTLSDGRNLVEVPVL